MFRDWTEVELISATLFLLTAVLLLYASGRSTLIRRRVAAIAALLSVGGADTLLLLSYAGEPAIAYERPGAIKRKGGGERGYFAFEQDGSHGHETTRGGSDGSLMAAVFNATDDKAMSALGRSFGRCVGCPEMVTIRPGFFRMGAAPDDTAATNAERPTRMIGFGAPWAVARKEVTVGQYALFLEATGHLPPTCAEVAHDKEADLPVTCVSWRDAEAYVAWLARETRRPFRLPTEAEWEYVARAGATSPYSTGEHLTKGAANIERADGLVVPVGSYAANGYGVHDTHGNAAELVGGCWTASPALLPGDGRTPSYSPACTSRVLRDAGAGEHASMTRLSARRPIDPDARLPGVGFRVAADLK